MTTYELTYIISPNMTSEEAESKAKEIGSFVQEKEGTILKQANPSAKTLSYPIKNHASGFMGVLEFQLEPEKMLEFKELLSKEDKIVRHMLIIKKAAELRKERRIRTKPAASFEIEKKEAPLLEPTDESPVVKTKKTSNSEKVELKDIEQKLDEILGE